jgi:NTE family protein
MKIMSALGHERQLLHFVDGGITDNLGLRAIQEIVEMGGGVTALNARMNRKQASQMMLISIDASTAPESNMDLIEEQPSVADVLSAVTDVQLRLYNRSTIDLVERSLDRWTEQMSVDGNFFAPYFVKLQFNDLRKSQKDILQFQFLNKIPTSFSLTKEEVDELIKTGRELLLNNPEFKRFMADRNKNLS